MKPILFLDIDGVLVTERWMRAMKARGINKRSGLQAEFDPECVKQLNRVINEGNFEIVVSSTWRIFHKNMRAVLERKGVAKGRVIGETPQHSFHKTANGLYLAAIRGNEIAAWLRDHKATDRPYVIVDDDADMQTGPMMSRLVQTRFYYGLTEQKANEVIAKLMAQTMAPA